MGIFKDDLNLGLQYTFLLKLGFRYSNGAQGESGYTKTIHHNGNEKLWITVNLQERKVYLYNEWDCGGELWKKELYVPDSILRNEEKFVDWLDEKIGDV